MSGWDEEVKAAHDMVSALCKPRGSHGSREWIMSIPARPDYDPDLVITSGLMAAKKHIKALEAQLTACAAGPWRTDVENAPKDGSEIIGWFVRLPNYHDMILVRWCNDFEAWSHIGLGFARQNSTLIAFAVPNPPQVKS